MPASDTIQVRPHEREILETLSVRVRIMTLQQVARTWWSHTQDPRANAARGVRRLADAGLVETLRVLARPELPLTEPLATWRPGQPAPDLSRIAHIGRTRFKHPIVTTTVVRASRQTAMRFTGFATRPPRKQETTHEIHVAAVYLLLRAHKPALAAKWRGEWLRRPGERRGRHPGKTPDALIVTEGKPTAVEFVGHYTPDKLMGFHKLCEDKKYRYELW